MGVSFGVPFGSIGAVPTSGFFVSMCQIPVGSLSLNVLRLWMSSDCHKKKGAGTLTAINPK
jgi:hypothetical protein